MLEEIGVYKCNRVCVNTLIEIYVLKMSKCFFSGIQQLLIKYTFLMHF